MSVMMQQAGQGGKAAVPQGKQGAVQQAGQGKQGAPQQGAAPGGKQGAQGSPPAQPPAASMTTPRATAPSIQGAMDGAVRSTPNFPLFQPEAQGHHGAGGETRNPNMGASATPSAMTAPSTTQGGGGSV